MGQTLWGLSKKGLTLVLRSCFENRGFHALLGEYVPLRCGKRIFWPQIGRPLRRLDPLIFCGGIFSWITSWTGKISAIPGVLC